MSLFAIPDSNLLARARELETQMALIYSERLQEAEELDSLRKRVRQLVCSTSFFYKTASHVTTNTLMVFFFLLNLLGWRKDIAKGTEWFFRSRVGIPQTSGSPITTCWCTFAYLLSLKRRNPNSQNWPSPNDSLPTKLSSKSWKWKMPCATRGGNTWHLKSTWSITTRQQRLKLKLWQMKSRYSSRHVIMSRKDWGIHSTIF